MPSHVNLNDLPDDPRHDPDPDAAFAGPAPPAQAPPPSNAGGPPRKNTLLEEAFADAFPGPAPAAVGAPAAAGAAAAALPVPLPVLLANVEDLRQPEPLPVVVQNLADLRAPAAARAETREGDRAEPGGGLLQSILGLMQQVGLGGPARLIGQIPGLTGGAGRELPRAAAYRTEDLPEAQPAPAGARDSGLRATARATEALPEAEAAGGAAGAEGLAAAAGPVGLALAGVDVAARLAAGALNFGTDQVKRFGEDTAKLASNDNLGALTGEADRAGAALGKIPIVGQVAEAGIKAVTTTIGEFDRVVTSFVQRGAELARYSGELTEARQIAQIRQLQGDIRESQALSPDLARLTDAQSRASDELAAILLPIKQFLVEHLANLVEVIANMLTEYGPTIAGFLEAMLRSLEVLVEAATFQWDKVAKDVAELPRRIQEAADRARRHDPPDDFFRQFAKLGDPANLPRFGPPAAPPVAPDFGVPAFGGAF